MSMGVVGSYGASQGFRVEPCKMVSKTPPSFQKAMKIWRLPQAESVAIIIGLESGTGEPTSERSMTDIACRFKHSFLRPALFVSAIACWCSRSIPAYGYRLDALAGRQCHA
jgi:hypothetical protein